MVMLPLRPKQPHEGNHHYKQKIRVAMALQKRLTEIMKKGIFYIDIEHTFHKVKSPIASEPVNYIADVFVYGRIGDSDKIVLDIEVDGKTGHGTVYQQFKNQVRDELITKKLHVQYVIRIPMNLLGGVKTHPNRSVIGRSFTISPMTEEEILDFISEKSDNKLKWLSLQGDNLSLQT